MVQGKEHLKKVARDSDLCCAMDWQRIEKGDEQKVGCGRRLMEPRVQGARYWLLDKSLIIEVLVRKPGPWTVRLVFQGQPTDIQLLETQKVFLSTILHSKSQPSKCVRWIVRPHHSHLHSNALHLRVESTGKWKMFGQGIDSVSEA